MLKKEETLKNSRKEKLRERFQDKVRGRIVVLLTLESLFVSIIFIREFVIEHLTIE